MSLRNRFPRSLISGCVLTTLLWWPCCATAWQFQQNQQAPAASSQSNNQTNSQSSTQDQSRVNQTQAIQSATTQYLILKTGSVYSGQLEFGGGKYVIRRNNGSSVRFVQGEVDFITRSMIEAYNRLFARVEPDDVIGHQRLASWCLRNEQLEPARQQLAILKNLERTSGKKSRMIALLERQVNDLATPRDSVDTDISSEQPSQSANATNEQVANQSVAGGTGIRRLPSTETRIATRAELRQTVDSYDIRSIRDFNRTVHMRIVNGCAAASCHGDPDNPMRIWRVDNRGGIASTGIQRNLHSISKYLDRQNPLDSKLLKYVAEIHAEMDAPAYEKTSHHYHAIRAWVASIGTGGGSIGDQGGDAISQTSFEDQRTARAGLSGNLEADIVRSGGTSSSPPALPMLPDDSIPAPINLSIEKKRFVPRDEFDPAIFNRKRHPNRAGAVSQDSVTSEPFQPSPIQPTQPIHPTETTRIENQPAEQQQPNPQPRPKRTRALPPVEGN